MRISKFFSALFFIMCLLYAFFSSVVFAEGGHLPNVYNTVTERIAEIEKPEGGDGAIDMTKKLIIERFIPLAKFLFIGVGLIFLGMYAYQVVLGKGEEDQLSTGRENIMYAGIGFALVALSGSMAKILDPIGAKDKTQILQQSAFESVIMLIVNSLEILLGTLLVILIFYAGMKMVMADGDEEELSSAKNMFLYSFIGVVMLMIAKPLVTQVFYPKLGTVDIGKTQTENFLAEAFGVLEYILQFLGILVFVSFVYASVNYLIAGTDDDKKDSAKTILLWSVVGIVIVLFSYSIVLFFVPTS